LKKPKAGIRNKALKAAETDSGNVRKIVLMSELLPKCIQQRPDGFDTTVPVELQLDDLETEDYDLLFVALSKLMTSELDKLADKAEEKEKSDEEKKISLNDSPNPTVSPSPENTEQS